MSNTTDQRRSICPHATPWRSMGLIEEKINRLAPTRFCQRLPICSSVRREKTLQSLGESRTLKTQLHSAKGHSIVESRRRAIGHCRHWGGRRSTSAMCRIADGGGIK
jgi:hypothetical protein